MERREEAHRIPKGVILGKSRLLRRRGEVWGKDESKLLIGGELRAGRYGTNRYEAIGRGGMEPVGEASCPVRH